jgi:Base plate wedge protein 53
MVYELDNKKTVVRDILRRATFISEYKPYTDLYYPYTIIEGDTVQSLAMELYGSPFYHWVILMFNEIHNPYFEWPLDQYTLEKLCIDKYGADVMYQTKHFEKNGIVVGEVKEFSKSITWIPPTYSGIATAVSFYEYEQKLNDAKRLITLLRPELLGEFVSQFEAALNE